VRLNAFVTLAFVASPSAIAFARQGEEWVRVGGEERVK
jgi:hypothetical protein